MVNVLAAVDLRILTPVFGMPSYFNIRTWQGKVVATTAVVAGVYGVYLLARKPKDAKKEMDVEQLVAILGAFAQGIDECSQHIAKQEKMIRQKMRISGRSISDEEMFGYCQTEFSNAMEETGQSIYAQFKTTEGACKKAWLNYRNHERVLKLEETILAAADVFGPKGLLPDSFTEAHFLQVHGEVVEAFTKAMETSVAELAKRGVTGENKQQFMTQFRKAFQQKSQLFQTEILLRYGVSDDQFNTALLKFRESPEFQAQTKQLEANQLRILESAGL